MQSKHFTELARLKDNIGTQESKEHNQWLKLKDVIHIYRELDPAGHKKRIESVRLRVQGMVPTTKKEMKLSRKCKRRAVSHRTPRLENASKVLPSNRDADERTVRILRPRMQNRNNLMHLRRGIGK